MRTNATGTRAGGVSVAGEAPPAKGTAPARVLWWEEQGPGKSKEVWGREGSRGKAGARRGSRGSIPGPPRLLLPREFHSLSLNWIWNDV